MNVGYVGKPGVADNVYIKSRQTSNMTLTKRESYQILDIDIDRGLDGCNTGLCDVSEREITLYKYNEIPDFLQGNPYVVHGYRVFLPFSLCLKRYTI